MSDDRLAALATSLEDMAHKFSAGNTPDFDSIEGEIAKLNVDFGGSGNEIDPVSTAEGWEGVASKEQMRDIKGLIQSFSKKAADRSLSAGSLNPQALFPNVLMSINKGHFTKGQYAFLSLELKRAQEGEVTGLDLQKHLKVLDENYEDWSKDMLEDENARNNPEGEEREVSSAESETTPDTSEQGEQEQPVESGGAGEDPESGEPAEEVLEMPEKTDDEIIRDYGKYASDVRKIGKGVKERVDDALGEGGAILTEDVDNQSIKELVNRPVSDDVVDGVIRPYIEMRKRVNSIIEDKVQAVRERVDDPNIDDALAVITDFERKVMHEEEVRLQENLKGDNKLLAGVKKGWGWLGDQNLASFMQKYGGYKPKDTFLGKAKHGLLRSVSFRTAATALLFTFAAPAGAALGGGALGAAGITGLFRGAMGASAGHAFTKVFLERGLRGRIKKLPDRKDLKKEDYEQVINAKKEYDALIYNYHADTADEVRDEDEYKKVEGLYCEAIKGLCDVGMDAEKVRMKQNLSETRARNIIKRNKKLLFGGTIAGGVVSGLVTPKLYGWAGDWIGGASDGVQDPAIVSDPDEAIGRSVKTRGVKLKLGADAAGSPATPPSVDDLQDFKPNLEAATPKDPRPVLVSDVDEAIRESMKAKGAKLDFEALEEVQSPREVLEQQGEVDTKSSAAETMPGEDADTQEKEGDGKAEKQKENPDAASASEVAGTDSEEASLTENADADSTETEEGPKEDAREFALEDGSYTVQEGDSLSEIWLAANEGDGEQMEAAMEALKNLEGSPEGRDRLAAFGITSGDIDLIYPDDEIKIEEIQEWLKDEGAQVEVEAADGDSSAQEDSETEETTSDAVEQEGDESEDEEITEPAVTEQEGGESEDGQVTDPRVVEQEGGEEIVPPIEEGSVLPKGAEVLQHTVSGGEKNVLDVLESTSGVNVPEDPAVRSMLEKQPVVEGDALKIHYTKDGEFLGVSYAETPLRAAAEPAMSVGETLPFTGNIAALVETAETLNAGIENVQDQMFVVGSDGTPILPVADFEHLRPDLFASERDVASGIVRGDDGAVLIQTDYTPQKRFFIETNSKGSLNHEYVQKEFETIEKTLKKPDAIHSARQGVIKKALYALAAEKPPANAALFDTLTDRLSVAVEGDADLTDRMFSEKGWGDERVRIAYSEDKGLLEVQERTKVRGPVRGGVRAKWAWKTVLTEVAPKK